MANPSHEKLNLTPSSPPSHEHLRAACQRHGFQDGSKASAHGPPQHLPWAGFDKGANARHPTHWYFPVQQGYQEPTQIDI